MLTSGMLPLSTSEGAPLQDAVGAFFMAMISEYLSFAILAGLSPFADLYAAFMMRIAAFLLVWFMGEEPYPVSPRRFKRIANNALVDIALTIAESKPIKKELIIKVVVSLINGKN
jgi:hypothetical protein